MQRDKNQVFLRGTIISDINVKKKSDKTWCHFQLATNSYVKGNEYGDKNIPTYLNIACFNPTTTKYLSTYARKGSRVDVEGKITVTKKDKNGYSTFYTNILVTDVAVLKSASDCEEPNPEESLNSPI